MRRHQWLAVGALILAIALPITANGASIRRHDPVEQAFLRSLRQYIALRDEVVRDAPVLEISPDPMKTFAAREAKALAIAAARAHAKTGDVFTADVQEPMRSRIREALAECGWSEAESLRFVDEDSDPRAVLTVNGPFPWAFGSAMLPCAIVALPPLPAGLEYRFYHTALVLVDVEIDLIVDILPGVFRELRDARNERFEGRVLAGNE